MIDYEVFRSLSCDQCHKIFQAGNGTNKASRYFKNLTRLFTAASAKGWNVEGSTDICPECQTKEAE